MKGNAKPLKVLVIEDDVDILNALNLVLGAEGYDVDVLRQGRSVFHNQFVKPDLFLLDYRLPDIDGITLCHYLKSHANYRDIPVVVISASAHLESKALAAGASIFFQKPFDINEIVNTVGYLIEEKSDTDHEATVKGPAPGR